MKLGTQTNSLFNHIMANHTVEDIVLGETGATVLLWTDRHAATVVDVFKKGMYDYVVVQYDDVKRLDSNGMSDAQQYEYSRDPEGLTKTFRVTADGFQQVMLNENGRYVKFGGTGLIIGRREEHYDFSF